jgi:ATP-binding cassette subfamily B protein
VYSNSLYLTNLCEYLALKPTIIDPPHPVARPATLRDNIQFRNVSFRYPGSERVALRNLDLIIPAGKIVVIVGPNGAGKSTLVKLLSRFYDPAEGSITLDGVPLSHYALEDLRSFFSILSQMPVTYDATVAENISLGDINAVPSMESIREAARRAGAEEVVARLPKAYDTLLGKSFADGTELSAGEWQRVSMARAFFRRAPVVLLDEPTSFMDPWSESAWFDRLRDLARNRTAVIVTHRFNIAMRADFIYVMDSGRVVESGTHAELIANKNLYAESWYEQVAAVDMDEPELSGAAVRSS